MRISDWSSDVCSSDLCSAGHRRGPARRGGGAGRLAGPVRSQDAARHPRGLRADLRLLPARDTGGGAVRRRTWINLIFFNGVLALMLFWAVNNILTLSAIMTHYEKIRRVRRRER